MKIWKLIRLDTLEATFDALIAQEQKLTADHQDWAADQNAARVAGDLVW